MKFPEGKNIYVDGKKRDSKSEIILSLLWNDLGLHYDYERPLKMRNGQIRLPDFTLHLPDGRHILVEHMGKLSDPEYAKTQEGKLSDYKISGYIPGKNLIITTERFDYGTRRSYIRLPDILWLLVKNGVVPARKVLKRYLR